MSQNTSFTDDLNTNYLSPFNFDSYDEIQKVPSSPQLFCKFSKNCPKNKIIKSLNKEKDKTSKNTRSTSITTNKTNNNLSNNKEKNKAYNNLRNILSQFLLSEEILMSSSFYPQNFIPPPTGKTSKTNKSYKSNFKSSNMEGEILEYFLFQKNEMLPNIIEPNKSELSYEKCYYFKKLSENIVSFYNEIIYNNEIIFPLKKKLNSIVLKIINQSINTSLKPYNIINLIIYGSQASGLSLPESDIDLLLIYYDSNNSLETLINELYKCLQTSEKFFNVTTLPKASSPLIKIEYKTNLKEMNISVLHMDISFHNIFPNKTTIYFTPSLLIVKYIQRSIEYLPQSKNIIIIIKKYLKNIGLNNYYTGGLSSFSIFLLVFSFYKYIIKLFGNDIVNNHYIGQFLVQFLDFYSRFNFSQYIININKEIPFINKAKLNNSKNKNYSNDSKDKNVQNILEKNNMANVIILDPFTLNNIAANSFRIYEIQQKFDSLKKNLLENYEKMYKIKKLYKIGCNNYDKFNSKGKFRNKNNYYFQYKSYNNSNGKEHVDSKVSFNENYFFKSKGSLNSSEVEEKYKTKISFEEYEKEQDFYNNNICPNFLEISIK